jgi:hypothetical protein
VAWQGLRVGTIEPWKDPGEGGQDAEHLQPYCEGGGDHSSVQHCARNRPRLQRIGRIWSRQQEGPIQVPGWLARRKGGCCEPAEANCGALQRGKGQRVLLRRVGCRSLQYNVRRAETERLTEREQITEAKPAATRQHARQLKAGHASDREPNCSPCATCYAASGACDKKRDHDRLEGADERRRPSLSAHGE